MELGKGRKKQHKELSKCNGRCMLIGRENRVTEKLAHQFDASPFTVQSQGGSGDETCSENETAT